MRVKFNHIWLKDTRAPDLEDVTLCNSKAAVNWIIIVISDLLDIFFLQMYITLVLGSSKAENRIPQTVSYLIQEKKTKPKPKN